MKDRTQPIFGKRQWVKLWTTEWLDGTTRYEITAAQRAFWIDLLAMAGRSRYPGIVCSGKNGDRFIGYPMKTFEALFPLEVIDIEGTLRIFEKTGKIRIEETSKDPVRLVAIHMLNWNRYQSNLVAQRDRTRRHRQKKSQSQSRDGNTNSHVSVTGVDVEVEVEGEENHHPDATAATRNKPGSFEHDDDLKKAYLKLCNDPGGTIETALDIVIERARKSGVVILTRAYLAKAMENFGFEEGQDREELFRRLRK